MPSENVENAILSISMVAAFLALGLFATGNILAVGPLIVSLLGFVYLTAGADQSNQWLDSFRSHRDVSTETDEEALTLLRQRYARGEIDHAEFERSLNDLLETETIEQAAKHRDETTVTERTQ